MGVAGLLCYSRYWHLHCTELACYSCRGNIIHWEEEHLLHGETIDDMLILFDKLLIIYRAMLFQSHCACDTGRVVLWGGGS